MDSWTFCHKCARMIWMSEIFSVGILPAQRQTHRSHNHSNNLQTSN